MDKEIRPADVAALRVVYEIPGMDAVTIRRDVPFDTTGDGALTMDVYYPPGSTRDERRAAIVFVAGFPDAGLKARIGCTFKEMESYVSWGQLAAASGIVAIAYENREPERDLASALRYVRRNAAELGIDEGRIGVWACSGNTPLALSVLMGEAREYARCAVLCYGFTLDLDGFTGVAEAQAMFGFANPCAGKSIDDLPKDVPLFVARAGQDQCPGLNAALDRFVAGAIASNLPITFANYPSGSHAFDLLDDGETSREIVRQILGFLRCYLGV